MKQEESGADPDARKTAREDIKELEWGIEFK